MSEDAELDLKTLATSWVDESFELFKSSDETKDLVKLVNASTLSDSHRATELSPITKTDAITQMTFNRFRLFGIEVSEKALLYVSMLVSRPGDISMLVAMIAHTFYPVQDQLAHITFEWLEESVFDGQYPSKEVLSLMWDKQKLPTGANLVDKKHAFQMSNQ